MVNMVALPKNTHFPFLFKALTSQLTMLVRNAFKVPNCAAAALPVQLWAVTSAALQRRYGVRLCGCLVASELGWNLVWTAVRGGAPLTEGVAGLVLDGVGTESPLSTDLPW